MESKMVRCECGEDVEIAMFIKSSSDIVRCPHCFAKFRIIKIVAVTR